MVVEKQVHWNEELAETYTLYLLSGGKSTMHDLPTNKRSNFRKRASDFVVRVGNLNYKNKMISLD